MQIERPGPVLILTKEDTREEFRFRYSRIGAGLNLSDIERRRFGEYVFVEDFTGTDLRLAIADHGGNLIATDLAEKVIRKYGPEGVALVEIDPLNYFGPGERFVNDGEAKVMEVGRFIARELGCCVRVTSHVSKEAARARYVDSHAGRGGSAAGDNARFVHVFVCHDPADETAFPRPAGDDREAVAKGSIFGLHSPKISGAPPITEPIWLERDGFIFRHIEGAAPTRDDRESADVAKLCEFLAAEGTRGIRHTAHTLEASLEALNFSRSRLRRTLMLADQQGAIAEVPLPESERRGSRKTCFAPVGQLVGEVTARTAK